MTCDPVQINFSIHLRKKNVGVSNQICDKYLNVVTGHCWTEETGAGSEGAAELHPVTTTEWTDAEAGWGTAQVSDLCVMQFDYRICNSSGLPTITHFP